LTVNAVKAAPTADFPQKKLPTQSHGLGW